MTGCEFRVPAGTLVASCRNPLNPLTLNSQPESLATAPIPCGIERSEMLLSVLKGAAPTPTHCRQCAKRETNQRFQGPLPEGQGQNLAVTVLCVPCSPSDSAGRSPYGINHKLCRIKRRSRGSWGSTTAPRWNRRSRASLAGARGWSSCARHARRCPDGIEHD